MGFSLCNATWNNIPSLLPVYTSIAHFFLGATLLVLAITQTLKQSVDMYKATKQWQPNQYMQLFVKDGILYFLVYVSLSLVAIRHHHVLPSVSLFNTFPKANSLVVFF